MIRWPCAFKHPMTKEVNAKLYEEFPKTPFGAFQRAWREEHCSQLDPYGIDRCPYRREDCLAAFYMVSRRAMVEGERSKVGLFRKLARAYGAERADNKPSARDTMRTDGQGPGQPGAAREDLEEGRDLRRSRPRSIASLFGEEDG